MPIDVLIVGQGLAGSLLAWELMRRHVRVIVIDSGGINASQVAAGLINPVTGQRLVKTAELERLLPAAMACYQQLAEVFKQSFFIPMPMLRILKTERERQVARQRLGRDEYRGFLKDCPSPPSGIIGSFGMLQQQQTGYLKTRSLLQCLQNYLLASGGYRQVSLDYREIVLRPHLQWRDIQPRHIVFCEGYQASANPWFGGLPFQPAKGEILDCGTASECPAWILNFGYWMIPTDGHHFRLGATFDPVNLDTRPSEPARNQLLQALDRVSPGLRPISVLEHQAGIRPATVDKQPFIGAHSVHRNLHIFNGFGAKGSLAIPWYARQFAASLDQAELVPATSHVKRYYDSHFPVRNSA
ncbi:FAD-binding oxidoreductase [Methylomonas sp. LL1]|uniref:NAD(P)/FAD-dependent oxidoreductase n=1 Tax=Methylomonas sp. LL1 TaxID=2785785 RepID=UPI0018C41BC0|nr:FAD-dependent oxidoreductase [Methylomonas sp. LL1]QPK64883.1 FAD-binding oxidoreductase [Methylomonas sp. LL1]